MTEEPIRSIPEPIYRTHVIQARSGRNSFQCSRDLARIMTKEEVVLLQDLINRASLRKVKKDDDGYFLCTFRFLEQKPWAYSEKEQRLLLDKLKRRGFLQTKVKGLPPRRWIKIKIYEYETALSEAISGNQLDPTPLPPKEEGKKENGIGGVPVTQKKGDLQLGPKGQNCIRPKGPTKKVLSTNVLNTSKKKKGVSGVAAQHLIRKEDTVDLFGGKPPPSKITDLDPVQSRLFRSLQVMAMTKFKHKLRASKTQVQHIVKLEKDFPDSDAEAVLDWYIKNYDQITNQRPRSLPRITSAKSLYKTFRWLLDRKE